MIKKSSDFGFQSSYLLSFGLFVQSFLLSYRKVDNVS